MMKPEDKTDNKLEPMNSWNIKAFGRKLYRKQKT